jgi:molybdenum cofactor cytidylyltransferase
MQTHNVAVIILAAGASSRLGTPKQLITYQGKILLRHICDIALLSEANSVYIVFGSQISKMKEEIVGLNIHIVENTNWQSGISTSIKAGVEALPNSIDAALLLLCDQPEITPSILNQLIQKSITTGSDVVACRYENTIGIPAIYRRVLFPMLCNLQGDQGAKSYLEAHRDSIITIDFPLGTYDIDTKEDMPFSH